MENNEIKEENVNEEVVKKNKKKIIIAIIAIIVIILIILIALIINNVIKDKSEIEGEETSNLAEADLDLTHMGITEYPTNWSEDVTIYEDKSLEDEDGNIITYYVPIPDGYVMSKVDTENNLKDGLVIYEGTEEVNDDNVETAKKTRNQWVWIPVNPENVYYENEDDVKYSYFHSWTNNANITTVEEGLQTITSNITEPYIKSNNYYYYEDKYLDTYYSEEDSIAEIYNEMRQNYEEMIASIEKYGGFYVGRYELGDNEIKSERNNNLVESTPVLMQYKYVYNYINWYETFDLCKELSINDNSKTSMIWGSLWDNILIWAIKINNNSYSDMIISSLNYGNYSQSSFEYKDISGNNLEKAKNETIIIPTGSSEQNKIYNIYDLAGNVYEWTMEGYTSSREYRFCRGGSFEEGKATYARQHYTPDSNSIAISSRPILYIR